VTSVVLRNLLNFNKKQILYLVCSIHVSVARPGRSLESSFDFLLAISISRSVCAIWFCRCFGFAVARTLRRFPCAVLFLPPQIHESRLSFSGTVDALGPHLQRHRCLNLLLSKACGFCLVSLCLIFFRPDFVLTHGV
jgi:hypothetical protein